MTTDTERIFSIELMQFLEEKGIELVGMGNKLHFSNKEGGYVYLTLGDVFEIYADMINRETE